MSKLDKAFQCGGLRVEGFGLGYNVRDAFEAACQCLEQLLLLC